MPFGPNDRKPGAGARSPGRFRYRWRRHIWWQATVAVLSVMAACAGPERKTPTLEPATQSIVWPDPPETARYALAGVLIGERDFIAEDAASPDTATAALRWIAGLVVGEEDYEELRRPVSGMTDASGRVYVVDASRKSVVVFDMLGKEFREWRAAAPKLAFAAPVAIAGDDAGGVLVTDSELAEVFRLDAAGEPKGRFGKGIVKRPTGIARDPATGTIYVTDTAAHDIKVFDSGGVLVEVIGARGSEPGQFNAPTHLAFHGDQLYVADTLNFRVQIFDRAGDGRLTFGRLGLYVGQMTRPKGVAVGRDGRIYVVESYFDHLLVFDPRGELLLPIGGTGQGIGQFYLPAGAWTDDTGRVYVADMFNGRVVVFKELTPI